MRMHEKSEANFKSIRVFKYRQMCSPSFCCPNSGDDRLLSSFFLWQRNDSYFHSEWIGIIAVFFYTFTEHPIFLIAVI